MSPTKTKKKKSSNYKKKAAAIVAALTFAVVPSQNAAAEPVVTALGTAAVVGGIMYATGANLDGTLFDKAGVPTDFTSERGKVWCDCRLTKKRIADVMGTLHDISVGWALDNPTTQELNAICEKHWWSKYSI